MTVERRAKVVDGVIVNVAEVAVGAAPDFMADWPVITDAGIGWAVDGDGFVPPVDVGPSLDERRDAAFMSRTKFAEACAVAGVISWAEAAQWGAGNALPADAQTLVDQSPVADRGPLEFKLLTSERVWRRAPEVEGLAVIVFTDAGTRAASVDALFGIV